MRACRGHKSSVHFHWDHHFIFKMYIYVVKVTGNSAGMIICLQSPVNDGSSLNNWFLSKGVASWMAKEVCVDWCVQMLCWRCYHSSITRCQDQDIWQVEPGAGEVRTEEGGGDTHRDTDMVTESAVFFRGLFGCFTLSYHWYDNDVHHFQDSTKQ